ncbi:MAG: biotin--[acetyl-CoA-carboxylase] ligase [Chthonomonadales bacterium]|nr:biotin--[acetyl-CoA-carboxylase] ligase [Chthonomonadales bacterium]
MQPPRIRAFADGNYLLEFDTLASTQDEARERVLAGEERLVGVRADYQEQGRGRRGASWYAPRGECLLITYLLPVADASARVQAMLSMAAAVAVADGIAALTSVEPRLRWPNDVLMGSRKLAGVLIELIRAPSERQPDRHVAAVGIGLNVNVPSWSGHLANEAISLRQATGRRWSIEIVEAAVRTALIDTQRHIAGTDREWLHRRWMSRDATVGLRYIVGTPRGIVSGIARRITVHGELVIVTDAGDEIVTVSGHHTR